MAEDGVTSLREAVTYANTHPGGDTITFGVNGTIALQTPLPEFGVTGDLNIQGPGPGQLTVERAADAVDFPIFVVPRGAVMQISGLTVRGGRASGADGSPTEGAGIRSFGSLTIDNCAITDNYSAWGGGGV